MRYVVALSPWSPRETISHLCNGVCWATQMERFLTQVVPWSDAIPSVSFAGYAVPIRRAD
jgi:hypothetical protein